LKTVPVSFTLSAVREIAMPDISFIRAEIERMRHQIRRQQKDILALQRAGIPTRSAEQLLTKMRNTVDALCVQRDRLLGRARMERT
jgi:capsule polysaccharide export protein KpsE/RkpR